MTNFNGISPKSALSGWALAAKNNLNTRFWTFCLLDRFYFRNLAWITTSRQMACCKRFQIRTWPIGTEIMCEWFADGESHNGWESQWVRVSPWDTLSDSDSLCDTGKLARDQQGAAFVACSWFPTTLKATDCVTNILQLPIPLISQTTIGLSRELTN